MLPPTEWHTRFCQQARWTYDLRRHLFQQVGIHQVRNALDVGCGTGALMDGILDPSRIAIHGLDINRPHLELAMRSTYDCLLTEADAHHMPFPYATFDLVYCHFLLLWVAEPIRVVQEMRRVARPGATVLALAEPDYGGRIDYPPALEQIGKWQAGALRQQGADPYIGRKLSSIFHAAGLEQIETGVLGGQWNRAPSHEEWQSEWAMLAADFERHPAWVIELERLKAVDQAAWFSGERTLFVPTFYALGRAPGNLIP